MVLVKISLISSLERRKTNFNLILENFIKKIEGSAYEEESIKNFLKTFFLFVNNLDKTEQLFFLDIIVSHNNKKLSYKSMLKYFIESTEFKELYSKLKGQADFSAFSEHVQACNAVVEAYVKAYEKHLSYLAEKNKKIAARNKKIHDWMVR